MSAIGMHLDVNLNIFMKNIFNILLISYHFRIPQRFDHENVLSALFALDLGVVVGYLQHVPNQPLIFTVRIYYALCFMIESNKCLQQLFC